MTSLNQMTAKKEQAIVRRHNKLIESRHRLSIVERRFVLWIISQIKSSDEDFQVYSVGVREWEQFVGLKPTDNTYNEIYKMADNLTQRNVGITDKNDKSGFEFIPWFHRIRYKLGEGRIEAILHPDLKPFLLNLKEYYTPITLEHALLLKSSYSSRIYDLLKQYQSIGNRTILLYDLRKMMQLEKQYPKYADFRRYVLEVAQKEINVKTDISFTFRPVREGRKITAIFFEIQTTKPSITLENREETDPKSHAIFQRLRKHNVAEKTARELVADYDLERLEWHIAAYEKRKKNGKADGIGWLVDGIKSDYRPQPSLYEQEEEQKRKKAKTERESREKLNAEIDRLKKECDEQNRQSGKAFLDKLPENERLSLDQEFLQKHSSVPGIGSRFQKEGLENPMVLALYLLLLREKYPASCLTYRDYAKSRGAGKKILAALPD